MNRFVTFARRNAPCAHVLRKHLRALAVGAIPAGLLSFPLIAACGFGLWLLTAARERSWPLTVPSLALVVALAVAAARSPWPLVAWQGVLGMALSGAALVLLTTRLSVHDRQPLLVGLALGLIAAAVKAGYEVVIAGQSRALAFSFHPNIAGNAAMIATLTLVGGLLSGPVAARLLAALGVLGGLGVLVATQSRGAQLAFAAGVLAFTLVRLWQGRGRKLALALAVLALVAIAVGYEMLLELMVRRADLGDDPLNPLGRVFMWLLALELAAYRPFLGYGFGAWRELVPIIEPTFPIHALEHSHNLYLELLLDGGSLALVAFMGWAGAVLWTLAQQARRGALAAAPAMAAFIGMLVHNLFDLTLYQPAAAGLLWLALALGFVPYCAPEVARAAIGERG